MLIGMDALYFVFFFSIKGPNFSISCKTISLVTQKCSTHLLLSYCITKKFKYHVVFLSLTQSTTSLLINNWKLQIIQYWCKTAVTLKASNTMFLLSSCQLSFTISYCIVISSSTYAFNCSCISKITWTSCIKRMTFIGLKVYKLNLQTI